MSEGKADRLLAARQREAALLFQANQGARTRASLTLMAGFVLLFVATITAVAADEPAAFLPAPPTLILLAASGFQQFSDVTVMGTARRALERAINSDLRAPAAIYESVVADIRKTRPLVAGVRLLQAAFALVAVGSIVAGAIISFRDEPGWAQAAYVTITLLSLFVAGASYRDMLRAGPAAKPRVDQGIQ